VFFGQLFFFGQSIFARFSCQTLIFIINKDGSAANADIYCYNDASDAVPAAICHGRNVNGSSTEQFVPARFAF
jgi:hypothetical protein